MFGWAEIPRMRKHDPDTWTLTFRRADAGEPPTACRVRRLLKAALRCFGLRCIKASGPDLDTGQASDTDSPTGQKGA